MKLRMLFAVAVLAVFSASIGSSRTAHVIADGGPILVCPPGPHHDDCVKHNPLPPGGGGGLLLADGGPIMVCPPKDKECWIHNPLPPL